MKKLLAFLLAGIIFLSFPSHTKASPSRLNWGEEININKCIRAGNPLVEISQYITNDVDSGLAGNYWAFDDLNRQIQVWRTDIPNKYCAEVTYEGKFDSQSGTLSPGATSVLNGKEDGVFQGGYNATIMGNILGNPSWRNKGFVGLIDYACDLAGYCPGYIDWVSQYFSPGYHFSFDWWGWVYQNKDNIWVNSSDGNSGDII